MSICQHFGVNSNNIEREQFRNGFFPDEDTKRKSVVIIP